jgi:hypothetical protein
MGFLSDIFGSKPAPVPIPASTWQETQSIPGMPQLNQNVQNILNSELMGNISPQTSEAILNQAAARGVNLGMTGGAYGNDLAIGLTGQTSQGLQQQGLNNAMGYEQAVAGQQLNPALVSDIQQYNNQVAAAPSPVASGLFGLGTNILGTVLGAELLGSSIGAGSAGANAASGAASAGGASADIGAGQTAQWMNEFYGTIPPSSSATWLGSGGGMNVGLGNNY